MRRFLFVLVLLAVFSTISHAQKVAVVDETLLMKQYKPFAKLDSEMKAMAARWNDTATAYEKMMKQKADDFRTRSASMKAAERQAILDTLGGMQQALTNYRNSKTQQPNGEFWKERDKRLKPLIDKYKEAVANVAKREKIELVFNKGGVSYTVVPDITDKVLKELK